MDRQSTASSSTRIKEFGPWSEQYSSSGKRYFYNRETEVSQWEKPAEWREYERSLNERAASHSPKSSSSGIRAAAVSAQHVQQYPSVSTANDESKALRRLRETVAGSSSAQNALQVPPIKRVKVEEEEDPIGPIVFNEDKYRPLVNKDIVNAATRTVTDELIQSSWMSHNLTMMIVNVSCDIRCAQSLVRTAEMRSNLLAQQLLSISDHLRQLESSFNLPNLPSSSGFS